MIRDDKVYCNQCEIVMKYNGINSVDGEGFECTHCGEWYPIETIHLQYELYERMPYLDISDDKAGHCLIDDTKCISTIHNGDFECTGCSRYKEQRLIELDQEVKPVMDSMEQLMSMTQMISQSMGIPSSFLSREDGPDVDMDIDAFKRRIIKSVIDSHKNENTSQIRSTDSQKGEDDE